MIQIDPAGPRPAPSRPGGDVRQPQSQDGAFLSALDRVDRRSEKAAEAPRSDPASEPGTRTAHGAEDGDADGAVTPQPGAGTAEAEEAVAGGGETFPARPEGGEGGEIDDWLAMDDQADPATDAERALAAAVETTVAPEGAPDAAAEGSGAGPDEVEAAETQEIPPETAGDADRAPSEAEMPDGRAVSDADSEAGADAPPNRGRVAAGEGERAPAGHPDTAGDAERVEAVETPELPSETPEAVVAHPPRTGDAARVIGDPLAQPDADAAPVTDARTDPVRDAERALADAVEMTDVSETGFDLGRGAERAMELAGAPDEAPPLGAAVSLRQEITGVANGLPPSAEIAARDVAAAAPSIAVGRDIPISQAVMALLAAVPVADSDGAAPGDPDAPASLGAAFAPNGTPAVQPRPAMFEAPPAPPAQVADQIADAVRRNGDGSIELALSPKELGTVRMNIQSTEAGMTITLMAEREATMDLMRRYAGTLHEAFRDLGLGTLNLSFGGRDGGSSGSNPQAEMRMSRDPGAQIAPVATPYHTLGGLGGLDLRM